MNIDITKGTITLDAAEAARAVRDFLAKNGIATADDAVVPGPITLHPFSTRSAYTAADATATAPTTCNEWIVVRNASVRGRDATVWCRPGYEKKLGGHTATLDADGSSVYPAPDAHMSVDHRYALAYLRAQIDRA